MRTLFVGLVVIAWWMLGWPAFAQVPHMPFSYTAMPLNNQQLNVPLLSTSAIGVSYLTVNQDTGNPFGSNGTLFFMNHEAMRLTGMPGGMANVERGVQGTRTAFQGALSKVWIATARYYGPQNPGGRCNPFSMVVRPNVVIRSGLVFDCVSSGLTWGEAAFSWSVARFPWNTPADQGIWVRVLVEQGTWRIAELPWSKATFAWNQIAK